MTDDLHPGKAGPITVAELRSRLEGLRDDMVVCIEVTSEDGDAITGSDLHLTTVEERCDGVECLYLWGDQDIDYEEDEDE